MKENHFDDSHVFSAKQGLNIAVGVYQPNDPITHQLLDPSYGRIRFLKWRQETLDNGDVNWHISEISSHPCSSEELGLSGRDHKFFSAAKSSQDNLKKF